MQDAGLIGGTGEESVYGPFVVPIVDNFPIKAHVRYDD